MSGIAGIFERDGRPVEAPPLYRMIAASRHRGPDGSRVWKDGPVGLVHQLLQITSDEGARPQPIINVDRGLAITFAGRIDNRDDLAAALGADLAPPAGASDADLVLAAYQRWGRECPARLLGDFVFAVWDAPRRLLFCARDPMGIKPLYYYVDHRRFVWGCDLPQIFASGCVEPEPNEGMVAEYLSFGIRHQAETLYRGVMRLPPAHSITVTSQDVRIARYWRLDPARELHYGTDEEYAEHFRALFAEAVACRLRGAAPCAAAYLSGGLDSSSVVAMARSLGHDLETFSLVFPNVPEADERRYIDDVVDRWHLTAHKLQARPVDGSLCRAHVERRFDVPDLPSDLVGEDLLTLLRGRHHHVVLTGIGGDYGLTGSVYHFADMLQAGDFRALGRQFVADARLLGTGSSLWQLLMSGVGPLLPIPLKNVLRPVARQFGCVPGLPEWVNVDLAKRTGLADRLRPPRFAGDCPPSRRHIWDVFASGWPYVILERNERSAAEYGIDERHPFLDRRLVEFSLALPESQRWRGQQTKYVLRRAMRDLLPDSVCRRGDKGDFSYCVPEGLEALGGAKLLDNMEIASLGWVSQDRVSAMYREARRLLERRDDSYDLVSFQLWMLAGIELWYRTMFLKEEPYGRFETVAHVVAG